MYHNLWTIAQYVVLDIILPTTDTYGDVNFAYGAFSTQNYGIGSLMITPVMMNLVFNIWMWKTANFDGKNEKYFTWILVLLNFWPQYQILKLIYSIVTNVPETQWKEQGDKINKNYRILNHLWRRYLSFSYHIVSTG